MMTTVSSAGIAQSDFARTLEGGQGPAPAYGDRSEGGASWQGIMAIDPNLWPLVLKVINSIGD